MMSYTDIDPQIDRWVERHALHLFTNFGSAETRCTYLSSEAGECFQIWIEASVDGYVSLYAAGVEGRRDLLPPQDWRVPVSEIDQALEDAFDTVTSWMKPSLRYFPTQRSPNP